MLNVIKANMRNWLLKLLLQQVFTDLVNEGLNDDDIAFLTTELETMNAGN